ncbi:MAG: phage tail sheath subtilisin-like domain-containing protein [Myxococcota bacterium]
MASIPQYPGVHVVELPSSVRPIAGTSTSVTGFIGRAPRGPTDRAVLVRSVADFDRHFGGIWFDSLLGYMVHHYFRNGGRQAIVARTAPGATPATATVPASGTPANLLLAAANPGPWGDNLQAQVEVTDGRFTLVIEEIDPSKATTDPARIVAREAHPNLGVATDDARRVDRVLGQHSRLARATALPENVPLATGAAIGFGGATGDSAPVLADYRTALRHLAEAGTVNLLCLAPPTRTGDVSSDVWGEAVTWATDRRAMVLVDPPASWSTVALAAARTGLTSITSPNATFYYPRVNIADPLRAQRPLAIGPGAAAAGVMARTDGTRGVWKAPAGFDAGVSGISTPALALRDSDSEVLNPAGINAIREIPGAGPVLWGARTADGADVRASQWKYLPVRRLALFIEESLVQGLQWVVFEPNDEPLWSQIRLNVGAFMNNLFRQGAFQGATAREAYFVKCDSETTQPGDVNLGVVNVLVGFAPLKPAEFVVLQFQQLLQAS